jgi:hypothetical protein
MLPTRSKALSSKKPKTSQDPNYISPEKCQEVWASFISSPQQISIPDWHMKILEERLARDCVTGIQGTPFEEFEKDLLELLMKG